METKPSSSSGQLTLTAFIEGPTGRTCYVKLEKSTTGMFFTTGWSKFVQDHSLKEHELLIFRYNGCMSFTVLVFDTMACEKKDWSGERGNEGINAQLKPKKLAFDEEKSVSSTEPMVTETETEEEEEENFAKISAQKRKKELEGSKRDRKPLSRRPPVREKEMLKVQQAAYSFASKKPFFVVRLKASHVYSRSMALRFPVEFSRKYLPRTKTNVVLRVSSNSNSWSVVYIPYAADRDRLSKGWSLFVRDNFLEEDNYCAFELVKSAEFLVHIFRVSEVLLPSFSRARKNAKA